MQSYQKTREEGWVRRPAPNEGFPLAERRTTLGRREPGPRPGAVRGLTPPRPSAAWSQDGLQIGANDLLNPAAPCVPEDGVDVDPALFLVCRKPRAVSSPTTFLYLKQSAKVFSR